MHVPPFQNPKPPTNNADPDDSPCPDCGGTSPSGPARGEPTNLATGAESYEPDPDITVYNPSGPAVVFQRNFRSERAQWNQASPGLSAGWGHNYDVSVQGPQTAGAWGALTLTDPNGAQETLTPTLNSGTPTGTFTVPAGSSYLVTGVPSSAAGQWLSLTLTWKDRTKWLLTPGFGGYVLSQITNALGNSLSLAWTGNRQLSAITDVSTSAVLLTLSYTTYTGSSQAYLSKIVDAYGRKVVYSFGIPSSLSSYTSSGLYVYCLTSVTQIVPASQTTSLPSRWAFDYAALYTQPLLSSITVPSPTASGVSVCQINYDTTSAYAAGKVLSVADGNGNQRVYTYGAGSAQVQVKNPANTVVLSWTQNFDGSGRDTGITDANGHSTAIVYGDAANPNQPTSVTDRNGHQTQYTYDQFGNVKTITSPRSTVTTYAYDYSHFALGEITSVTEGSKSATVFHYSEPSGLISKVDIPTPGTVGGATTASTSYLYDALGNLTSLTTPGNGTVASLTATFNYTDDFGDTPHSIPALTGQTAAFGQPSPSRTTWACLPISVMTPRDT